MLATTSALADPAKQAAIEDFIRRLIKAQNWAKSHQAQWVADYYVNVEHQTPQVAKLILAAGGTSPTCPSTPECRAPCSRWSI